MSQILLEDVVRNVVIIAHKEDSSRLECAFATEGFNPQVFRRCYSKKEQSYSQSIRVLLSHIDAWRLCSLGKKPTIICEADFVPCKGFGRFPIPIPSDAQGEYYIAWLYSCGPTIYHLDMRKPLYYIRGHCAAPVALLLTPAVADKLYEYGLAELQASDPYSYSTWDTRITAYLKRQGICSYISLRNYGEHGGEPNSEHRVYGNLPAAHRADSLMASLHFLPAYSRGSEMRFLAIRLKAKLYGLIRVFLFRLIGFQTLATKSRRERSALFWFVWFRACSWY